ncbi:MAG TPA: hypothetical protein VME66_01170 [Candidatus Acidoferrales bacterium]|nr:hypothetical protein [Candidatus Acidoferrales bacterium]
MNLSPELLLIGAVLAVGVLHTIVPDHWLPIMLIARQEGWSKGETARAALIAGVGHTLSTLGVGLLAWIAGSVIAVKFGALLTMLSSAALIGFGGWIVIASIREIQLEMREVHAAPAAAAVATHVHVHRHRGGLVHTHRHAHLADGWHSVTPVLENEPPLHEHEHERSRRTALLLILGSSPMIEGIPAFFAAAKYGAALIAVMAVVFALSTIGTYVVLSLSSVAGLQSTRVTPFERYGEVLSGAVIALVGLVFLFAPAL